MAQELKFVKEDIVLKSEIKDNIFILRAKGVGPFFDAEINDEFKEKVKYAISCIKYKTFKSYAIINHMFIYRWGEFNPDNSRESRWIRIDTSAPFRHYLVTEERVFRAYLSPLV